MAGEFVLLVRSVLHGDLRGFHQVFGQPVDQFLVPDPRFGCAPVRGSAGVRFNTPDTVAPGDECTRSRVSIRAIRRGREMQTDHC